MISATLLGRLGRDPEVRTTNTGTPVMSLNVATNSGYGENKTTTWVRASMFGARAEKLAPMLAKGSQVMLTGEMSLREYTTQAGEARTSLELRVSDLVFAGSKPDAAERQEPTRAAATRRRKPADPQPQADQAEFDDDIPF